MKLRPSPLLVLYTLVVVVMAVCAVQASLLYGAGNWLALVFWIASLLWLNWWVQELRQSKRRSEEPPPSGGDGQEPAPPDEKG